jgi:hypothetical protein
MMDKDHLYVAVNNRVKTAAADEDASRYAILTTNILLKVSLIVSVCARPRTHTQAVTITIICLISPDYATWYTIVLSYLICALTILYTILSTVIHYLTITNSPRDIANWAITVCQHGRAHQRRVFTVQEVVSSSLCVVAWMFICALCADVSLNTNDESGYNFGWAAVGGAACTLILSQGLCAINILLSVFVLMLFASQVVKHAHLLRSPVVLSRIPSTALCTPTCM